MADWDFIERFTSGDMSWKTQAAVKDVKAAAREIKKVGKKDAASAAEGVVLFFENISQALSLVDCDAAAIKSILLKVTAELAQLFSQAELVSEERSALLQRIYVAYQADQMDLTEALGESWGLLCSTPELASKWADSLLNECRLAWGPERGRGYIVKGMSNCLSALLHAKRYQELLDLLALAPRKTWLYHHYGVWALAAQNQVPEALAYADEAGADEEAVVVARLCEELLLKKDLVEDAYRRYGLRASETNTYHAWYHAILSKYPQKAPADVLADLAAWEPEHAGKWFAAAKSAGLYDEALELIKRSPCSPETLIRATRDYAEERPKFAIEVGMAALRWLAEGHGYDKTEALVHTAFEYSTLAATHDGTEVALRSRLKQEVESGALTDRFVRSVLLQKLEEPSS